MNVPTWKVLVAVTVIFTVTAVILSFMETPLLSVTGIGTVVFATVFSGLFYVMVKRGYQTGRQLSGEADED